MAQRSLLHYGFKKRIKKDNGDVFELIGETNAPIVELKCEYSGCFESFKSQRGRTQHYLWKHKSVDSDSTRDYLTCGQQVRLDT